jgi:hypothetical protein
VLILVSSFRFEPKVIDQTLGILEQINLFSPANVLVIGFAGLVVEAKHANAANHEGKAIFERMRAAAGGGRKPPDHDFGKPSLPQDAAFPKQRSRSRVGNLTNTVNPVKDRGITRLPHRR